MNKINVTITQELAGKRLDFALHAIINNAEYSRTDIKNFIDSGLVMLGTVKAKKPSHKVVMGDEYIVEIPPPQTTTLMPVNIPLDIVFEDEHLMVINKQKGLTVHPGSGTADDTLVHAILYHTNIEANTEAPERPGIVHRLDRDTGGLMVVAKNNLALKKLSAAIAARQVKREYLALCWGVPKKSSGTIETFITRSNKNRTAMMVAGAGKNAVTHYKVVEEIGNFASLIKCNLQTGRTHQIRVHLTHIGTPIIGDQVYGKNINPKKNFDENLEDLYKKLKASSTQSLCSVSISFEHPVTGEQLSFELKNPKAKKHLGL